MMRYLLISSLMIYSFLAFSIENAPMDFNHKDGKAVFVDFQKAYYKAVFDFKTKTTMATSTIEFYQDKPGYPIFDLLNIIIEIKIDGIDTSAQEVTPPGAETKFLVLDTFLPAGMHTLVVKNDFDFHGGSFRRNKNYLDLFFHLDDLDDRLFLEIFFVSSFEYDKVDMVFEFKLENTNIEHKMYHNGVLELIAKNHFKVTMPSYYTTSSPFLHIVKTKKYHELNFTIPSIAGRDIPVTIYSDSLRVANKMKREAIKVVAELEQVVAPWPHPALVMQVYEGGNGMEYVGALTGGDEAVRHEIIHSYFARGVMPLDGRSAWIDESLTTWMEEGYQSLAVIQAHLRTDGDSDVEYYGISKPHVNRVPPYIRHTNDDAYDGSDFFAYLNYKFSSQGGLKAFLPYFFNKYKFLPVTTEILKMELESFYMIDLTAEFNDYVY